MFVRSNTLVKFSYPRLRSTKKNLLFSEWHTVRVVQIYHFLEDGVEKCKEKVKMCTVSKENMNCIGSTSETIIIIIILIIAVVTIIIYHLIFHILILWHKHLWMSAPLNFMIIFMYILLCIHQLAIKMFDSYILPILEYNSMLCVWVNNTMT